MSRWQKLRGDVRAERGRLLLLTTTVALSLTAVGTVLGGFTILSREMARAYLATQPASATFELSGDVDDAVVARARQVPGVREAVAKDVLVARASLPSGGTRPVLLFVVDDFNDLRLALLRSVDGAWPPPPSTLVVERTALGMLETRAGERVRLSLDGRTRDVVVSGVVHDPSLAPATQERQGYAWIDRATLSSLFGRGELHELRVAFAEEGGVDDVAAQARALIDAASLTGVHQVRVPPPREHPHQRQMKSILWMLLSFAGLALLLSAVLVATSLAALMARQVREIGVMKTLGARTSQVAALYATLVLGLALAAVVVAVPLGAFLAPRLAGVVAHLLNFDLASRRVETWALVVEAAVGLLLPLLLAAVPVVGAARTSVKSALDSFGAVEVLPAAIARLPPAVRNAFRRPRRTALVVVMLAVAAAIFLSALNVSASWRKNMERVAEQRFYDVEVRLSAPAEAGVVEEVAGLPAVARVEAWGFASAAIARAGDDDGVDVVRTYPDRGHGSFVVLAPPPSTSLVRLPLREGRWLQEGGDEDGVVLNLAGFRMAGRPALGDVVKLSIDGRRSSWRLIGVVDEMGAAGVAYVCDSSFARVTGEPANRVLRLVARGSIDDARTAVDAVLSARGVPVEVELPLSELQRAVEGHIDILIRLLLALAVITGLVGALALGSTMSVNVLERTREIGVLRAMGASAARVQRLVVVEAVAVAVAGAAAGVFFSLPLTAALDALIGSLGFMAPLPFVIAPAPIIGWLLLSVVVGAAASAWPARRAGLLTVREALAVV